MLIEYQNDYDYLDNVEVLAVISMQKEKDLVTYPEATNFIKDILTFAVTSANSQEGLETASEVFLASIFSKSLIFLSLPPNPNFLFEIFFLAENSRSVDWNVFLNHVRTQLKYVSHFLHYYFSFKFLTQSVHFQPPRITPRSNIFIENNQTAIHLLCLLMFSNLTAALTSEFSVLYSANRSNFKFQDFVNNLVSYDGPTFILIKTENKDRTVNIFGGFKMNQWKVDSENYQGDPDSYVFSLYPRLCNFFFVDGETSMPFFNYLNFSQEGRKNGVGFGGNINKNTFRIWLDKDTFNKSYTISEDITFENGYLVEPGHETLNVK